MHCQICLHPVPGHEPGCPVGSGQPVSGLVSMPLPQALQPTGSSLLVMEKAALLAEIERLKFLNAEERKTIEELSGLCLRAADALAGCTWQERDDLIRELRKAAE